MLFIVNCEIIKSEYMEDDNKFIMNHIVDADNEEEAKEKIRSYYNNKNIEYSVSYWVNFNYCNQIIK